MGKGEHIRSLRLRNFKCFQDFRMENIGQFNLIVGANNVGKTSLLEGLLLKEDWADVLLYEALIRRTSIAPNLPIAKFDLLHNYRTLQGRGNDIITLEIEFRNKNREKRSIEVLNFSDALKEEDVRDFLNETYGNRASGMFSGDTKTIISRKAEGDDELSLSRLNTMDSIPKSDEVDRLLPLIGIFDLYRLRLVTQYSESVQHNHDIENEFLQLLELIIPSVEAVDIYIDPNTQVPTLGLRLKGDKYLTPLSMFGDGTQRLFRVLTKLFQLGSTVVLSKTLLIDEVDFGIHSAKLSEFWTALIGLAHKLNVQLFMTTHNTECVRSFWKAFDSDTLMKKWGMERDEVARHFILERDKDGVPKSYSLPHSHLGDALVTGNNIMGR